ncbi:MAG: MFS transporter, partial [Candidatus Nanopelagicales bacterium]
MRRTTNAVYLVFIAAGVCGASWASRIPQVRDELGMTPAALGLVILAIGVGSLVSLPSAGLVVHRLGSARTIVVMAAVVAVGMVVAAVGVRVGPGVVVVGLFLLGFGAGVWDVAMNVEGAAVEQRLERSIMSRFHAGFSIGTVTGALVGVGMVALGVSVTLHLVLVAAVLVVAVPLATRWFLPAGSDDRDEESAGPPAVSPLRA